MCAVADIAVVLAGGDDGVVATGVFDESSYARSSSSSSKLWWAKKKTSRLLRFWPVPSVVCVRRAMTNAYLTSGAAVSMPRLFY